MHVTHTPPGSMFVLWVLAGGLALAVGLAERGIQAHVFEAAPFLRTDSGTIVGTNNNGEDWAQPHVCSRRIHSLLLWCQRCLGRVDFICCGLQCVGVDGNVRLCNAFLCPVILFGFSVHWLAHAGHKALEGIKPGLGDAVRATGCPLPTLRMVSKYIGMPWLNREVHPVPPNNLSVVPWRGAQEVLARFADPTAIHCCHKLIAYLPADVGLGHTDPLMFPSSTLGCLFWPEVEVTPVLIQGWSLVAPVLMNDLACFEADA